MAERYRKIDPRIWKDEKFINLSEKEKLICIYCLTAQSNRIGIFNFSPAMAAEDLGISLQTFREGFVKVCETFGWRYDEHFRVLYIPKWFKYNKPENPNVLKGNLKDLHELPKSPLIQEFINNTAYLPETFIETFREGLGKGLGKPSRKQEQEQEQELNKKISSTDKDKKESLREEKPKSKEVFSTCTSPELPSGDPSDQPSRSFSDNGKNCPHQEIIDLYHQTLPSLPRVRIWNDKRRRLLQTRWAEDRERQSLDWWRGFFEYISQSDFLTGRRTDWKADLEWIVRPENFIKIINGRYHRGRDSPQELSEAGRVTVENLKSWLEGKQHGT